MPRPYYIFKSGRIKRKENTISIEQESGEKKAIPVEDVEMLHLFGEMDLNTKFLNFISQSKIPLHVYNYYGFYAGSFLPREKYPSGVVVVKQVEHYLDFEKRLFLAKAFIEGAVFHILRNLRAYKETEESICKIQQEFEKVDSVKSIPELMGIEGRIRVLYYQTFNVIFKGRMQFEKREKRPPTDPVNALISFGNSLIYTTVLSEIYQTQLNPTISYLHEPREKRYSLSLDVAEIFKPFIADAIIFKLVNNNMISLDDFDEEVNYCYLSESGRKKFLKEFDDKLTTTIKHRKLKRSVSYKTLIRLECYKLIKHFISDEEYSVFKAWW